jgi:hypothetical protein
VSCIGQCSFDSSTTGSAPVWRPSPLPQVTQRSYAIVITKVERYLAPEQVLHFTQNPIGMAKKMKAGESFIRLLENTPLNRVFPISVYGYSAGNFPAHYRDEFGRLLPQNINPPASFGLPYHSHSPGIRLTRVRLCAAQKPNSI